MQVAKAEGTDKGSKMREEFDGDLNAELLSYNALANTDSENTPPKLSAKLVAYLYNLANAPLRTQMLARMVRPLGSLGLVAVASGAFANLLGRTERSGPTIAIEEVGRYSSEQIFELARFVEQVSPEAIQQVIRLVVEQPIGLSALGASILMALAPSNRTLRRKRLPTNSGNGSTRV